MGNSIPEMQKVIYLVMLVSGAIFEFKGKHNSAMYMLVMAIAIKVCL